MPSPTHFTLRVTPSDALRTIISVSKKVSNKAVLRNRTRRRIRPILSEIKLGLKPATYLLIVRPGAELLKGQALRSELVELFKKR